MTDLSRRAVLAGTVATAVVAADADASPSSTLADLINAYLAARQAYNDCLAGPDDTDDYSDPFHEATWRAYRAVLHQPATTIHDVLQKIAIVARETVCIGTEPNRDEIEAVFQDIHRVTGILPPLPCRDILARRHGCWWPKGGAL